MVLLIATNVNTQLGQANMLNPDRELEADIFLILKFSTHVGRKGGKWFENEPHQQALAREIVEGLKKGHWTFERGEGVEPHSIP